MRVTTAGGIARYLHTRGMTPSSRPWIVAWLGGPVIGIANGVTRELVYKDAVGDLTAHQISTVSAIGLFAGYFLLLQRQWPLPDDRSALRVGGTWLALTILFELGFGRAVDGKSWSELLADYDLSRGRVWTLVLAWLALGPFTVRRLAARRPGSDAAPRPADTVRA
jgi:hypothetical protein